MGLRRRRFGRRRRHGGGAPRRVGHAGLRTRSRRRSARDRGAAATRRLRRAGLSCLRLREPRDELELSGPPLRRRVAPGARPEVRPASRRALSARRRARRLHGAQRDDLHAAACVGLEPDRAADRRPLVARVAHAPLRATHRGLPPPAAVARAAPHRHRSDGAWLARLAADREIDPARIARRRGDGSDGDGHQPHVRRRLAAPVAEHAALAARRRRPERAAVGTRQFRGSVLHAFVDSRASPRRRARALARGCGQASGPIAHRARCIGHASDLRRRWHGVRRRIPEGAALVSRARGDQRCTR